MSVRYLISGGPWDSRDFARTEMCRGAKFHPASEGIPMQKQKSTRDTTPEELAADVQRVLKLVRGLHPFQAELVLHAALKLVNPNSLSPS